MNHTSKTPRIQKVDTSSIAINNKEVEEQYKSLDDRIQMLNEKLANLRERINKMTNTQ